MIKINQIIEGIKVLKAKYQSKDFFKAPFPQ